MEFFFNFGQSIFLKLLNSRRIHNFFMKLVKNYCLKMCAPGSVNFEIECLNRAVENCQIHERVTVIKINPFYFYLKDR